MMSTPALSARSWIAHLDAAVDGGAGHRRVIREAVNLVFDLHRELARRRQHQHAALRAPVFGSWRRRPFGDRAGVQQPLQRRDDERAVLPVPVSAQAMRSPPPSASGMTAL